MHPLRSWRPSVQIPIVSRMARLLRPLHDPITMRKDSEQKYAKTTKAVTLFRNRSRCVRRLRRMQPLRPWRPSVQIPFDSRMARLLRPLHDPITMRKDSEQKHAETTKGATLCRNLSRHGRRLRRMHPLRSWRPSVQTIPASSVVMDALPGTFFLLP
jgi:hypothetical protein